MFERFTDRARRVVILAQEEARKLNCNYIGTEHLLLGIIAEGEGPGVKLLEAMGANLGALRQGAESVAKQGAEQATGHIPFTPRSKKALELSLREALQLGNNYIGTEHLLLGLLRDSDNTASEILKAFAINRSRAIQTWAEFARQQQESRATPVNSPVDKMDTVIMLLEDIRNIMNKLINTESN